MIKTYLSFLSFLLLIIVLPIGILLTTAYLARSYSYWFWIGIILVPIPLAIGDKIMWDLA